MPGTFLVKLSERIESYPEHPISIRIRNSLDTEGSEMTLRKIRVQYDETSVTFSDDEMGLKSSSLRDLIKQYKNPKAIYPCPRQSKINYE